MNKLNKVEYIKIEFLTPTHVGIGIEKKWLNNIDFIIDHNIVKLVDINKTYLNLDSVSKAKFINSLSKGNVVEKGQNKIKFKDCNRIITQNKNLSGIQSLTRTGFGEVYLPGSSIKGALRSALFHDFNLKNKSIVSDKEAFGETEKNFMQYLKISDFTFNNDTKINRVKIFNLMQETNEWVAGWKHRGGKNKETSAQFKQSGFTTDYETFPANTFAFGKLMFTNGTNNELLKEKLKNLPSHTHQFFKVNDFFTSIFKILNNYTLLYINKEIEFFEKFENNETQLIIDSLQKVKENITDNKCVIRMGCGSGFYAMTGDWKYDNHIGTINKPGDKGIRYKSRKISFEDNIFAPMGFISISRITEEEYKKEKEIINHPKQNINSVHSMLNTPQKIELKKIEEKPKYYTGQIKNGVGHIYAEIIENGKPNKVKIFIKGYEQNIYDLYSYSSEIEKGKIIKVKINQCTKSGEIKQIGFESQ